MKYNLHVNNLLQNYPCYPSMPLYEKNCWVVSAAHSKPSSLKAGALHSCRLPLEPVLFTFYLPELDCLSVKAFNC